MLETPVLFLVFNRPEQTRRVFSAIRDVRPKKLFIAADGPRANRLGEEKLCEEVRNIVLGGVDWPCEVKTLFKEKNLGCGKGVSSAISWFFDSAEQGIILEDDVVPDPTFFSFCEKLLDYYRTDDRVYSISGSNFQDGHKRGNAAYYFSRYNHIWGWATWRRAWAKYDYEMQGLDEFVRANLISRIFKDSSMQSYWNTKFLNAKSIDTWDYQWTFAIWRNNGISITPNVNLTRNIGFGPEATHTIHENPRVSGFSLNSIADLIHPGKKEIETQADSYTFYNYYSPKRNISLVDKLKSFGRKLSPFKD